MISMNEWINEWTEADGLDLDQGYGMEWKQELKKYFMQDQAVVFGKQVDPIHHGVEPQPASLALRV